MCSIARPGSRSGPSRNGQSKRASASGTRRRQPFVTKPPAFDRQGVSVDDLIDFTPELRAEAVELIKRYKIGPLFTPPVVSKWDGPLGTLMLPSNTGGTQLAGRRARSGNQHPLHLLIHQRRVAGADQRRLASDMDFGRGRAPDPKAAPATAKPGGGGGGGGEAERQLPFAVSR